MTEFAANIDLSSLDGTTGFRINGVAAYDNSGDSVASAGDVNGDGFLDLIIGAYRADPRGSLSGASYVVFGSESGFGATLELSSLDGTNGFKLSGEVMGDRSGRSVASAGDINGDGFDDVIVGAASNDSHGSYTGASYVVFGQASGFHANLKLADLDGSNGFKISGEAAFNDAGYSVAAAGDVNNDGFADLILGAPSVNANGVYSGAGYVVFGKAGGFGANLELSSLDGSNGFRVNGGGASDFAGGSVAAAGDVNGDGIADVIVGARFDSPNGAQSGASYVVFGTASGFGAALDPSSLDGTNGFRITGAAAGDQSGNAVASAGDVNGDGIGDLIIGAMFADPNGADSGASYVVFGTAKGFSADVALEDPDGSSVFRISGEAAGDRSGWSVASAGDVNGDGFDDLIIGAGLASPHGPYSGASYVVFGQAADFPANFDLSNLDGTNGFRISGEAAYDGNGRSVASAGDLNGDGFDDLIVGSMLADASAENTGISYVIYGRAPDSAVVRVGAKGDQTIHGGAFNDALSGRGGDDDLIGAGGDDTLRGGAGDDIVVGGAGKDKLAGGPGVDVFDFNAASDSPSGPGGDRILDFSHLAGDRIDLSDVYAGTLAYLGAGAFTHVAGQLRVIDDGSGQLVQADLNGDGIADMSIVVRHGGIEGAADFLL